MHQGWTPPAAARQRSTSPSRRRQTACQSFDAAVETEATISDVDAHLEIGLEIAETRIGGQGDDQVMLGRGCQGDRHDDEQHEGHVRRELQS